MADLAKLDAAGRQLLAEESASGRRVAVFIRGVDAFDEGELDALRADGAELRSVVGDIVTADVDVDVIRALTEHGFVRAIALSGPLYYDTGAEQDQSEASGPSSDVI